MTRASDTAKLIGAGATILDGTTISTADNTTQLTLTSTDADANVGPVLNLSRDNSSAADNDLVGEVQFNADDDGNNQTTYGKILTVIEDASNGAEDGLMQIHTNVGGTLRDRIKITSSELVLNEESIDSDFRVESGTNANMLFVDGGNNAVIIGHNDATNGTFASGQKLQMVGTDFTSASFGISRFSADASEPSISFSKSRSGTIGTDTVVQSGDFLGSIIFTGADGTDLATQGASISAVVDGTPGANDMPTRLTFSTTGDGNSSTTERVRIHNGGVTSFNNGIALGVGTANTASNVLDDYEEGTWTPAFLGASNPSVTYSIQTGHYTKIGQMVYVNMRIATNGVSGGSGTVRIGGLPFSSNSTSNLISVGAVVANSWTGEHPMKFRIINNGTDIYLYYRASLTANDLDNNSNVADLTTASGGHNVTEITATYFTSA